MAKRVRAACGTWEALAGKDHFFIGSIHFDMRASSRCFIWSLVKIILAKSSCITLGFVIWLALHDFCFITTNRFDVGARIGCCTWILLEIDLTEIVVEAFLLARHSFTNNDFLFVSYISCLVSTASRSCIWLFNEIQRAVLPVTSLCADCSRSIFAVDYFIPVVTELHHVSAYSRNSAWLFFEVYHTFGVVCTARGGSGFTSSNYIWISLICWFMSANILVCAWCFYEVKLAVWIG